MNWADERPSFNRAKIFRPIENIAKKLSYYPILCCDTYERTSISAFGDNFGKIFFVDTATSDGGIMGTDMGVSNSSIFDLCWYNSSTIAVASGEIDLIYIDIVKSNISRLIGHHKTIRSLKRQNGSLYTCGGDGKVISWDLRTEKPGIEMFLPKKAKNIITAIDIHKTEKHLVFATSTPGCTLNTWDIRYTKRGLHIAKECNISDKIATDIFYLKNFLYFAFSDGSLLRTTETGIFMNFLTQNDSYNLSSGKINFDERNNFILTGIGEKVVVCDPQYPTEPEIFHFGQINGISSVFKEHFITYDDNGDMKIYNFVCSGINNQL